jgi:hypothetical protein
VMLFEPGARISALTGRVSGSISISSGNGIANALVICAASRRFQAGGIRRAEKSA